MRVTYGLDAANPRWRPMDRAAYGLAGAGPGRRPRTKLENSRGDEPPGVRIPLPPPVIKIALKRAIRLGCATVLDSLADPFHDQIEGGRYEIDSRPSRQVEFETTNCSSLRFSAGPCLRNSWWA